MTTPRLDGFAPASAGIPTVGTTAERNARYPTPPTGFKVWNRETQTLEIVVDGAWSTGPATGGTTLGWYDVTAPAYGATGTGSSSSADRLGINAAIVAANAAGGGVVYVPPGTYMIAPRYDIGESVILLSNVVLYLARGAVVQAIAGSVSDYAVLYASDVDDIAILGEGHIVGERAGHVGSTGEHGHCLRLIEARGVIIDGPLTIRDGWGDGVYFGSNSSGTLPCQDVYVSPAVTVSGCRRNGISAVGVHRGRIQARVDDINGTAPQSGIDIESNFADECQDVVTEGAIVTNCVGYGLQIAGSAVGAIPLRCGHRNAIVKDCGGGIAVTRSSEALLDGNVVIDSVDSNDRMIVMSSDASNYSATNNHAILTSSDPTVTPLYLQDVTDCHLSLGNRGTNTAALTQVAVVNGVTVLNLTSADAVQVGGTGAAAVQCVVGSTVVQQDGSGHWKPNSATQDLGTAASTWRNVYAGTGIRVANIQVVGAQQAHVADPAGGTTVDAEARTAIAAILDVLDAHGLTAAS